MTAMYQIAKKEQTPDYPLHLSPPAVHFLDSCLHITPEKRWSAF